MCASYWTIKKAELKCPKCGEVSVWKDIQTHFMGGRDGTMCMDYYELGKPIPALGGVTITLDGIVDDFIGSCSKCRECSDIGAEIKDGVVKTMWVLPKLSRSGKEE